MPVMVYGKIGRFDTLANDNRCLTFHKDLQKNLIQKKVFYDSVTDRPLFQKQVASKSRNFLIHYDTIGAHKVDLTDNNSNGIPDYVDSVAFFADYIYQKEVVEMGFLSPLGDSLKGGTDAFDIYLCEIGDGEENPDPDSSSKEDWGGTYGFTAGELLIYPLRKFHCYTSYIVIDNNYSIKDSIRYPEKKPTQAYKTLGLGGAKVSLAHEFFHAIQNRYGVDNQYCSGFSEMCAVAMEQWLFPEYKDYMQYVRSLFKTSEIFNFVVPNPDNGYRYCLFPMMIEQKYGIGAIRKMWEEVYNGVFTYKAIDNALVQLGTNLNDEWMSFMDWIYHTNYRAVEGKYFRDAELMPIYPFYTTRTFTLPSYTVSGSLPPYQIRFDQVVFQNNFPYSNDTLKLFTTHLDLDAAVYGDYSEETFSQVIVNEQIIDYERIFPNSPIAYYYKLNSILGHIRTKRLELQGVETQLQSAVYPNPFHCKTDEAIYFPAPEDAMLGEEVILSVYNENMKEILQKKLKVTVNNTNRVLIANYVDFADKVLSTGIYIYRTENEKNVRHGKLVVINE